MPIETESQEKKRGTVCDVYPRTIPLPFTRIKFPRSRCLGSVGWGAGSYRLCVAGSGIRIVGDGNSMKGG